MERDEWVLVAVHEEEEEPEPEEPEEERGTRRLLALLLVVLSGAALGLLFLLLWLLRPETPQETEGIAGYPIRVERIISSAGDQDPLVTPLGVAFDADGNVWISDTGNSRVLVFSDDGDLLRVLGAEKGPDKVYSPYGIAIDAQRNRAYVADYGGRQVQIYSTSGSYIGHYPAEDQELRVFGEDGFSPYGLAIVEGRVLASSNDGLYLFDGEGRVSARYGTGAREGKPGAFNFPDALTVDPSSGTIYVADSMNRRIVSIDGKGRVAWVSGTPDVGGAMTGFWQLPRGITLGPDGNLYVVDTFRFDREGVGTGHIVVLSPEGELISEFGRYGLGDDDFDFPEQITARADGLFAVADREHDRVVLFRLEGALPAPDVKEAKAYEGALATPKKAWALAER